MRAEGEQTFDAGPRSIVARYTGAEPRWGLWSIGPGWSAGSSDMEIGHRRVWACVLARRPVRRGHN